jgi:integrase
MAKVSGVYQDQKGLWYFKARTHKDPLTGKWVQVTRRGFRTATDASRARRELLEARAPTRPAAATGEVTLGELLDQYLEDAEANDRLAAKTLFDYRQFTRDYIVPWIGHRLVSEIGPDTISAWQKKLLAEGSTKTGRPLSPNTVRLARAPLNAAYKYARLHGLASANPVAEVSLPRKRRSIPKHWSPEQAREFLSLTEGDPLWPAWAVLLGSGLRIGELVALRWANVDLERQALRVVDFVSALGYEVVESDGKSRDAVRTVDLDDHLVSILREQHTRTGSFDHVFTRADGTPFHPQYLSKLLASTSTSCGLPRLTAHGLRHTSATLMLASGVPPKIAAERLGHADATLFSNLYSHVTPTMQRSAAEQVGNALFGD